MSPDGITYEARIREYAHEHSGLIVVPEAAAEIASTLPPGYKRDTKTVAVTLRGALRVMTIRGRATHTGVNEWKIVV